METLKMYQYSINTGALNCSFSSGFVMAYDRHHAEMQAEFLLKRAFETANMALNSIETEHYDKAYIIFDINRISITQVETADDVKIKQLKHRLKCIKEDVNGFIDAVKSNPELSIDLGEATSKSGTDAWTYIGNIEIAVDLNDDESLKWRTEI